MPSLSTDIEQDLKTNESKMTENTQQNYNSKTNKKYSRKRAQSETNPTSTKKKISKAEYKVKYGLRDFQIFIPWEEQVEALKYIEKYK